ncbi:glutathione synthase [Porticoccus litoralis]|uniref:Glutathione synthetase n=1 Tax=Porticoccus litoralis TaxID=434086 RepID=A0AAW8B3P6_9GAMM|nr:glutathione synthase [Porticoccus litoralis]MDP1520859.1 glutathione synthase [Porticoccus litoralis]
MTRTLGVVMDPIEKINPKKDTTLVLLLAAQQQGWQLMYMEQSWLAIENGEATASMAPLEVYDDPESWFKLDERRQEPLASLDAIIMRKDPPFDSEYIYTTYILEAAERLGTLVVNKPQSLRDCNEKVFATLFPECSPPLLVSRDPKQLKAFRQLHDDVVYKPLDGMGGTAVFRVRPDDPNLSVIIEMLTQHGQQTIMAQKFIPDISNGDKRILMVDGEPIPYCLARIPAKGELRGNLAAGGSGVVRPLSDRDRWIAAQIGPVLKDKGILFAGLDVIGDYLTEINITSPTCAREINREQDTDIGGKLMDAIAKRLS